jgi:beta-galactosidase GanA
VPTKEEIALLEQRWSNCLYKPEYNQALIDHLSAGYSFTSFSVDQGVSYCTLLNWCKRFPAFQEAREIGEKGRLKMLEAEGLKMVKGGNVVAWKFMMNQSGVVEKTEVKHSHQGNVFFTSQLKINAPERYARLQKLKELNKRVKVENEILEAEVIEDNEDSDLDML